VKDGLRANAGKPELIKICIRAWTVIRILLQRKEVTWRRANEHALETYFGVMQRAEDDAIAQLQHEDDKDLNDQSLKMPPGENNRGYLEDGATLPEKQYRFCAACGMESVHHPPGIELVKKARADKTKEWRKAQKQWAKHKEDPNKYSAPINPKTKKPYTAAPSCPTLDKMILCCKAWKMVNTRGVGGYKCDECDDRSCAKCTNRCRFVCSTE